MADGFVGPGENHVFPLRWGIDLGTTTLVGVGSKLMGLPPEILPISQIVALPSEPLLSFPLPVPLVGENMRRHV